MKAFLPVYQRFARSALALKVLICCAFAPSVAFCAPVSAEEDHCLNTTAALRPIGTPAAIPYTRRDKAYEGALAVAGVVVAPGQAIPKDRTEDGIYVYLVVRKGGVESVIWSERSTGEQPDGKYLATHDSLTGKANEELGPGFEVIAAGQVVLANGVVARLDNRSSTRQGNAASLRLAEAALRDSGLKFVDSGNVHTLRIDFNTSKNPDWDHHAEAEEIARLKVQQDADNFSTSSDLIRAFHQTIYERRPELRHPTIPGFIDVDRIFSKENVFRGAPTALEDNAARAETRDIFRLLQREGVEVAARYLMTPQLDSFGEPVRVSRFERFRAVVARVLATH